MPAWQLELFLQEMAAVHKYEVASFVRGHHIYKSIWTPVVGELLKTEQEPDNEHDEHSVTVIHQELGVVSHIPKMSKICSSFTE